MEIYIRKEIGRIKFALEVWICDLATSVGICSHDGFNEACSPLINESHWVWAYMELVQDAYLVEHLSIWAPNTSCLTCLHSHTKHWCIMWRVTFGWSFMWPSWKSLIVFTWRMDVYIPPPHTRTQLHINHKLLVVATTSHHPTGHCWPKTWN